MLHPDADGDDDNDGLDDDDASDLDLLNNSIFADYELIGEAMWHESPEFRERARDLATKLIVKFTEGAIGATHSLPTYTSKKHNQGSLFDLDIDATIEYAIENPREPITPYSYERRKSRFPVVLMLDTSFSMSGTKLIIAGLTVATLSKLIPTEDFCVMGFAKNVYPIKKFDEEISSFHLISRIFGLIPKGATNISEALRIGSNLVNPHLPHSRLIFLTDADPTTGSNPLVVAGSVNQLDLLLFPYGNKWLAEKLVFEAMRGNLYPLKKLEDVFYALQDVFANI